MSIDSPSLLETFEQVCANPYQQARAAAEQGVPVAGLMCSYSPQELFHAAGYLPVRILGRAGATPRADQLVQTYSCSFARSALDSGLAGELDFLRLAVFSHTCDTLQNVADLWKRNCPGMQTLIVSTPNQTAGAAAQTYFRKELARVRAELAATAGPISDDDLRASMVLHARHRATMQRLYALRRDNPGALTGRQMMAVVTASFLMPKEEHLEKLTELLGALEQHPPGQADTRPRVLVAGSVCQDLGFIGAIEDAGCRIVDDDLCMGARSFLVPEAAEGDPLDALADQYLARTPCPAFHCPGFDPGTHLLERAQQAGADGVVFLLTKFCDPWAFDYAHAKNTLDEADIPALMLEVEQNLPVPEQFRTRTGAFVEILQSRAGL